MPRRPLFAVAEGKLARARADMQRLGLYLEAYETSGLDDVWSRTATIAFAVHGAYTGVEDVMTDIARAIDGTVPQGATSHQALLDQMRSAIEPPDRPCSTKRSTRSCSN